VELLGRFDVLEEHSGTGCRRAAPLATKRAYKDSLRKLQVELRKLPRPLIQCDDKILIIFEGRGAAGKV